MDNWNWPQWFYFALLTINVLTALMKHDQPKPAGKHNFQATALGAIIAVFVLHCGGFW